MIPDRVSLETDSPYFWPQYRKLGVLINGMKRQKDVVELFCVSEGWADVFVRNSLGQLRLNEAKGVYLTERVQGKIEPYWIDNTGRAAGHEDAARLAAAEQKRQRKAEKRMRG